MGQIVRLAVHVMPDECWPLRIRRRSGITLVYMEARARRWELTQALLDHLEPDELVQVRLAYGQPAHGRMERWVVGDGPAILYVPPELRQPGMPALQGDEELERRMIHGPMDAEMLCLQAERVVTPR